MGMYMGNGGGLSYNGMGGMMSNPAQALSNTYAAATAATSPQNRPGANSTTGNNINNGVSANGGAQVPGKSGTNPGTPTSMALVSAMQKIMGQQPGGLFGNNPNPGQRGTGLTGSIGNLGNAQNPGTGIMGSIGNMFMGGGRVRPAIPVAGSSQIPAVGVQPMGNGGGLNFS